MSREYIASVLKRLRAEQGMTADEVGEIIGKSGKTVNGFQFKLVAGFKLPAQFRHIHIHSSWRSICLRIPRLVHELGTGKSLSRIGKELVDDIELPCRHKEDRNNLRIIFYIKQGCYDDTCKNHNSPHRRCSIFL